MALEPQFFSPSARGEKRIFHRLHSVVNRARCPEKSRPNAEHIGSTRARDSAPLRSARSPRPVRFTKRKVAFSRGSLRDEPTDEMACRSRALVRAAREATRPQASRVRGTRGLASPSATRARGPHRVGPPARAPGAETAVGPFCVVSAGAVVGPGCRLGAGVHLLGDVELGAGCVLRSHAVVGAEVRRARRVAKEAETRETPHDACARRLTTSFRFFHHVIIRPVVYDAERRRGSGRSENRFESHTDRADRARRGLRARPARRGRRGRARRRGLDPRRRAPSWPARRRRRRPALGSARAAAPGRNRTSARTS